MYLSPRFPREAVVQRQVLEGVHAIVDLDYAAQMQGKIPIQVFIRLGNADVRFETYQGIDPNIAAELVLREKTKASQPMLAYPPSAYAHAYHQEAPPPTGYSNPYQHPAAAAAQLQPAPPAPDLSSVVGQLDNSSLQTLLASLQSSQGTHAQQAGYPGTVPHVGGMPAPQIDINALLGNLRNAAAGQPAMPAYGGVASYGSTTAYPQHASSTMSPTGATVGIMGVGGNDTAQQVQTIMEQLKRATQ